MAFKTMFIAQAPDADYQKHNNMIETGKFKLCSYVVSSKKEVIKVCKDLYEKDGLDSVMLCPGFSHEDVADIFAALDQKVAVSVARADGPSNSITAPIIQREFFGK
jgi:hypothetical protein